MSGPPTWTRPFIGIPFEDKGRDFSSCDCLGLVRLALRMHYNVNIPSFVDDYRHVEDHVVIGKMIRKVTDTPFWRRILLGDEKDGDVITLHTSNDPNHIGLIINPRLKQMLHTERATLSGIERYDNLLWYPHRVSGVWRHRNLDVGT